MHVRVGTKPASGPLPMERLNTGHIEDLLAGIGRSAGTQHRIFATLRAALNSAVKARKRTGLDWNPCQGIEDMEPENPPEAQRWTPAEAARFIAHVADDKLGLLFRVMVQSGGRPPAGCAVPPSGADPPAPPHHPPPRPPPIVALLHPEPRLPAARRAA